VLIMNTQTLSRLQSTRSVGSPLASLDRLMFGTEEPDNSKCRKSVDSTSYAPSKAVQESSHKSMLKSFLASSKIWNK
jgi:hypothetical protein